MNSYLVVMIGGALGAVSRYAFSTLVLRLYPGVFPAGTLLVNLSGSFLIGLLMTMFLNRPILPAEWRLLCVTGILGGYTTFSSFEWEVLVCLRSGNQTIGLLYLALSVVFGLLFALLGLLLGNRIWPE